MRLAGLHFVAKAPREISRRLCRGNRMFSRGLRLFVVRLTSADPQEVMDGAWAGPDIESLGQGDGDLSISPAPLAQFADQFRAGLKLAAGWPGVGLGKEFGDLVIEVHALAGASTVRLCSGLFGGYSGKFGNVRRLSAARAEWTRICPNSIRLCSGLFGSCDSSQDILRLFSKKWMREKSGRKEKITTLSGTAGCGLTAHSS